MEEKTKKSIFKRWWFWIIVILVVVFAASGSNNTKTTSGDVGKEDKQQGISEKDNSIQELKLGDTWTVDGQWKITIHSVETTQDRNQFSDKTPKQVVFVTYSYENLGYEDNNGLMEGLYFDLEPGLSSTVIDASGEVAYSYPNSALKAPQQTPVGAKCSNAQCCIGLENESDIITMNISKYDGNGKQQKVTYKLDVK